jgi:hypothetical protein
LELLLWYNSLDFLDVFFFQFSPFQFLRSVQQWFWLFFCFFFPSFLVLGFGFDCLCIIGFVIKIISTFLSLHTRILGVRKRRRRSNFGVTHIALMSNYDQFHTYFPLKWLKLEVR